MKQIETIEISLTNVVALRERVVKLIEEYRESRDKASSDNLNWRASNKNMGAIVGILRVADELGIDLRIDKNKMDYIVHDWQPRRRLNKFEMGALSTIKHMQVKLEEMENGNYTEEEFIWTGDDSEVITKKFTRQELDIKAQGLRDSIKTITKLWKLEAHI